MDLVRDLRGEIVDDAKPLSSVLRKAKILASQLNHAELKAWLSNELNGYESGDNLPSYRRLHVPLLGTFFGPFGSSLARYPIPVTLLPEPVRAVANDLPVVHPVREIETLVASSEKGLRNALPTEAVILSRDTITMSGGLVLAELYQPITPANLEGILDAARTRFLDFLLGLQELDANVLDSDAALERLSKEDVSRTFNLTVYGDHNVIAPHSTLGDVSINTVKANDFDSLAQLLSKTGINGDNLRDLREAIRADGARMQGSLGTRVQQWIGKMVGEAVGGTWRVALSAAPELLKEAIQRYYGWK